MDSSFHESLTSRRVARAVTNGSIIEAFFILASNQRCFLLRNQGMFMFGDGVKTSYVYYHMLGK
jgi:hypothetical protein